jgi:hypothetical protein
MAITCNAFGCTAGRRRGPPRFNGHRISNGKADRRYRPTRQLPVRSILTLPSTQIAGDPDAEGLCVMISVMGVDEPYTTVAEPTFVARLLLGPSADTVANVDAFVELADGSTWTMTIFTEGW